MPMPFDKFRLLNGSNDMRHGYGRKATILPDGRFVKNPGAPHGPRQVNTVPVPTESVNIPEYRKEMLRRGRQEMS